MFANLDESIKELQSNKPIILVDDESRENEGDIIFPAINCTPEVINFMAKYGRGLICLAITQDIANRLNLKPMVKKNTSKFSTAFTVSIGAKNGMSTGISAFDRCLTVKTAVDPQSTSDDISTPGHIFPVVANKKGLLGRKGHTEGSVEVMKIANLGESAVICEIMNDDGTMARRDDLLIFAKKHNLKILKIDDIK